jgi:anthranilate phosphoribosyltransferase
MRLTEGSIVMIQVAIKSTMDNKDLTHEEAYQVMNQIMQGEATPAQIGAFLVAAKLKGETYHEVAGFAHAMRDKAEKVETKQKDAIDMCGTGGDGSGSINVSTIASFVVAGGGIPVAKHGNRSISSRCGSADVLEALGININLTAEQAGLCLDETGMAFLFAPLMHKAMKYAIGPRREIGIRTVFNILGPLTNPASVKRQVLGVFDPTIAFLMAEVLRELGSKHVLIVHGNGGLDEVSISGKTLVVELLDGQISQKEFFPDDFGIPSQLSDNISGGENKENATFALEILNGAPGSAREIVVANAACGFIVAGVAKHLDDACRLARKSIDSGAALEKLDALREITNSF